MDWKDDALLLSVKKKSSDVLNLYVLTRLHGLCNCLFTIDRKSPTMLLPGCELEIFYTAGDLNKVGTAEIGEVDKGIIASDPNEIALVVMNHINSTLSQNFAKQQPVPGVFAATEALLSSFATEDGRWPLYFAQWELALLSEMGLAPGLSRCKSAYQHGETIYMSRRTGRAVSRTEAGAFIDRMLPVPSILMGALNCKMVEVHQAMELITLLATRAVEPGLDPVRMPDTREQIAEVISIHPEIPKKRRNANANELSEEERRKRLLSLRPLLIGARANQG